MQKHSVLEQILFEPLNETSSNARCWLPLNKNNNPPFVEKPFETIRLTPIGNAGSPYCVQHKPDYLADNSQQSQRGTERFRVPDRDYGYHMNYEIEVPGKDRHGKVKPLTLTNAHIDLSSRNYFDDDDKGGYY